MSKLASRTSRRERDLLSEVEVFSVSGTFTDEARRKDGCSRTGNYVAAGVAVARHPGISSKGLYMSGSKAKYADSKPEYLRHTSNRKANDDRIYTPDEREFMNAMQAWKDENKNYWPKWSDCLAVLKGLGYSKICPRCGQSVGALPITIPDPDEEEEDDPDSTPLEP